MLCINYRANITIAWSTGHGPEIIIGWKVGNKMGRMGRDTEQDRIGQADTSQKIACGKPESGKQEAPRLWGKRTANSSEIVHTVLGSLEAYLHSNPPDYRFQVESLLELLYYAFTEYNITESPEFKAKIGPLDRKLRDLAETDEAADEYMNTVFSLCTIYERQGYIEGIKVGARLMMELMG